ncbi:hypothetical protein SETIT_9G246200v2 [Setaria italica]|uniref:Uncharacterized protein n=1 Tax=Setaria italica TaxID=4555 RepID=A0A368SK50_SETIT|nr:hypothetical protein SETIT_9G246200v2 [Setaria italica]
MAVAMLRDLKYVVGSLLGKGEVMQDLEYSMRTKGDLTRLEEARLRAFSGIATRGFATGAAIYSFMGWFMTGKYLLSIVMTNHWLKLWYVDSAFVERLKETEAELNTSDNETGTSSRQTIANIRFGDLMDDPLACMLGSPIRDMGSHNPSENTRAVLKRTEPRNRKRSHRPSSPSEC